MSDSSVIEPAPKPSKMWLNVFRCFQIAFDPRKVGVAAVGILAAAIGWSILASVFYAPTAPDEKNYTYEALKNEFEGKEKPNVKAPYTKEDIIKEGSIRYDRDLAHWNFQNGLMGPSGSLRRMPWSENRGGNPYIEVTTIAGQQPATWFNSAWGYLKSQLPIMTEPLTKLLLPILLIAHPDASLLTRIYLVLVLFWSIVVWGFAGGIICRIAAVQISGKDRVSIIDAFRFVKDRFLSYILSPLVPLAFIGGCTIAIAFLGLLGLIPLLGDFIYALLLPLAILGGIAMTMAFIGLLGYPMMNGTLSTEGSDTFDALSRSYNYVFQAPWSYAWYWLVAIVYGAVCTFVVIFICSLMVYLGKWALTQTPVADIKGKRADYLFVYAPESFGWRELLLQGTDLQGRIGRLSTDPKSPDFLKTGYVYENKDAADRYLASYNSWNYIGAGVTGFWLVVVFLLMLGFAYSFFWSAATMIYLLMRWKIDEVEIDEVNLDEDLTPPPPASPAPAPSEPRPATLPMVAPSAPAEPPATLPMVPPTADAGTVVEIKVPPPEPKG